LLKVCKNVQCNGYMNQSCTVHLEEPRLIVNHQQSQWGLFTCSYNLLNFKVVFLFTLSVLEPEELSPEPNDTIIINDYEVNMIKNILGENEQLFYGKIGDFQRATAS